MLVKRVLEQFHRMRATNPGDKALLGLFFCKRSQRPHQSRLIGEGGRGWSVLAPRGTFSSPRSDRDTALFFAQKYEEVVLPTHSSVS